MFPHALSPTVRHALVGASLFALAGCAHVPASSLPTLATIDAETTPFSATRAAVALPSPLVPLPDGARLNVTLTIEGETVEERSYVLVRTTGPVASHTVARRIPEDREVYVYELSHEDQRGLTVIREQALEARDAGQRGSLAIAVSVTDLCLRSPLADGPLLLDAYLRTEETDRFVRVLRNYDMREDLGATHSLPPCDAGGAGAET